MVSQMKRLREQTSDRARWFRLGMVSATAMAPLVTRWRSLRAAERAQALWEASQERASSLHLPGRQPAVPVPTDPPRANVRAGLWLAGAGVGLVAAGVVAFVVARRRMLAREEQPLDLPFTGLNGRDQQHDEPARDPVAARAGAEAATARPEAPERAASAPTPRRPLAADAEDSEPDEVAPIIGDLRTLVYYDAGAPALPAEPDRVYFRSAQDALAAGFRAGE
jgi:hypothetical protein